MFTWQSRELVRLVREKYPTWEDFSHAEFVAQETAAIRKRSAQARRTLMPKGMREMLSAGRYADCIEAIDRLGRTTPLLWTGNIRQGDLAILHHPQLQQWEFCEQFRALLHDQRPSPDRLEGFAEYCSEKNLPRKWPFATYFLFLLKPHAEVFVKPRLARWLMRFMGQGQVYTSDLSADMYERYKKLWHGLKAELDGAGYKPADMIDLYAFLQIAYQVSHDRTGNLSYEAQVALDVPQPLREPEAEYVVQASQPGENRPPETKPDPDIEPDPQPVSQGDQPKLNRPYTVADLAETTGYPQDQIKRWITALKRKGQAVFYGPPGTGKTFLAQALARHLAADSDGLVEIVQFHQAYDYADFMEGIRPSTNAAGNLIWENRPGIFLRFCQAAAERFGPSVFIIDEMNRANLARVFGELMHLIEYRERSLTLAGGNSFQIPERVLLIGTMNTADYGLTPLDQALRRRFAFIHLLPDYDLLARYHQKMTGLQVDPLIKLLNEINDHFPSHDLWLGSSYFMTPDLKVNLETIWQTEIYPLLAERFFKRPDLLDTYRWEMVKDRLNVS